MSASTGHQADVLEFDAAVFDLDTVKRAVYRFSDQFSADISTDGSRIVCALSFNVSASLQAKTRTFDELRKEVLDQDLRKRVAAETAPLRNAILALAFSNSKLRRDE